MQIKETPDVSFASRRDHLLDEPAVPPAEITFDAIETELERRDVEPQGGSLLDAAARARD